MREFKNLYILESIKPTTKFTDLRRNCDRNNGIFR